MVFLNARVLPPTRIAARIRSATTSGHRSMKPAPRMMIPREIEMKCVAGSTLEMTRRGPGSEDSGKM